MKRVHLQVITPVSILVLIGSAASLQGLRDSSGLLGLVDAIILVFSFLGVLAIQMALVVHMWVRKNWVWFLFGGPLGYLYFGPWNAPIPKTGPVPPQDGVGYEGQMRNLEDSIIEDSRERKL
jgi:hypothetical protein